MVDHRGHVLARTRLAVRAVIVGDVELRKGRTIYARVGDPAVLVLAGLLAAAGWLAALRTPFGTDGKTSVRGGRRRRRLA